MLHKLKIVMTSGYFRLTTILFLSIIISSCGFFDPQEAPLDESSIINSNSTELTTRIKRDGAGVITISTPSTAKARQLSGIAEDDEPAGDEPFTRIANVLPPTYNGMILTASHVHVEGDLAYVAYNRMGPEYLGAIEIVDISDVYSPSIQSQIIFPAIDVSAVFVKDNYIYLAAARDRDQFNNVQTAAFLGRIQLLNGEFSTEMDILELPGFVATDIASNGESLFVTSGRDGQLSLVDIHNFQIVASTDIPDLRSVAVRNNTAVVLSGTNGTTFLNSTTLASVRNIPGVQDVPNAKRTIAFMNDYLLTSEGAQGAGVYNATNGDFIERIEIDQSPENVDATDIVTNAVSVTDDLLLMANGGAGLSILRKNGNAEFDRIGIAEIGGSSNYVQSEGQYIFAATGASGLQILRRESTQLPTNISCEGAITYSGSSWLNVNSGQNLAYTGAASLQGINVNEVLSFCGSLTVQQQLNLNSGSTFNMKGALAFGQYGTGTTMHINNGATLRVEGSLVIWGNLNLNSGATIEFVGAGSTVAVYGSVTKGNNVTITGNYTDAFGNL
ncbi:MAG: hypothetical protein LAT57_05300 [Balneolales bacterium]|nr:hypothetical protein [Balneolales bacterium]